MLINKNVHLMFIGPCVITIVDEWKTNLMSFASLFHLLCAQHNMFRTLIYPSSGAYDCVDESEINWQVTSSWFFIRQGCPFLQGLDLTKIISDITVERSNKAVEQRMNVLLILSLWPVLFHHLVPLCCLSSRKLAISILLLTPAVHTPILPNAPCLQNSVIFSLPPLQPTDSIHSFLVPCGFQQKNSFPSQLL